MKLQAHQPHKPRAPLKTVVEMAASLNLSTRSLAAYLGAHDGPKPALKCPAGYISGVRTYYEAGPVRRWWQALLLAQPELAAKHGL